MTQIKAQFDEDRKDALQEVVNIAMGQAGDSLAKLFGTFVELSIPKFHLCDVTGLNQELSKNSTYAEKVTILRQPFSGQLRGEGIALFNNSGVNELASLMGYEGEVTFENEREMLLDVCSILVGDCLNGVASQLEISLSYTAPTIITKDTTVEEFFKPGSVQWRYAMIMEICLTLEQYDFTSNMLLFLSEESFPPLMNKLDQMLDEL